MSTFVFLSFLFDRSDTKSTAIWNAHSRSQIGSSYPTAGDNSKCMYADNDTDAQSS